MIKKMKISSFYFILFLLNIGCDSDKKIDQLKQMASSNDYRFYRDINFFSLEGINEIKKINSNIEYPVYGLLKKSKKEITIATIYKDGSSIWKTYYINTVLNKF